MFKFTLLFFSMVYWCVMMNTLIETEILPYLEYDSVPTYRNTFGHDVRNETRKMVVSMRGRRIGTIETHIEPMRDRSMKMTTTTDIRMKPLSLHLISRSTTHLTSSFSLESYRVNVEFDGMFNGNLSSVGTRKGDVLEVLIQSPLSKDYFKQLPYDEEMLSDSFFPLIGGSHLHVGKKWKIKTVDVNYFNMSLKYITLWSIVSSQDRYVWQDKEIDVFHVEVMKNLKDENPLYTMIVTKEGLPLVQYMNIGNIPFTVELQERVFNDDVNQERAVIHD